MIAMHTSRNALMGSYSCPVCTTAHSESCVLDPQLGPFLGWALCEECEQLAIAGNIACVEVSEPPLGVASEQLASAQRTGRIFYVERQYWGLVFDGKLPEPSWPMAFIHEDSTQWLQRPPDGATVH